MEQERNLQSRSEVHRYRCIYNCFFVCFFTFVSTASVISIQTCCCTCRFSDYIKLDYWPWQRSAPSDCSFSQIKPRAFQVAWNKYLKKGQSSVSLDFNYIAQPNKTDLIFLIETNYKPILDRVCHLSCFKGVILALLGTITEVVGKLL